MEGEKEGMEAIAFLKKESLGRGSFIPIGVQREWRSRIGLHRKEGGSPLPLLQFVKVKEGFAPIAEFLIGDVGVVEHLEEALHWMKKEGGFGTLVTLEGDVVERSGVMSGGSRDQGLSILERRREIRELRKRGSKKRRKSAEKPMKRRNVSSRRSLREKASWRKRKKEIQEKEIELLHQERDLEGLRKEISQFHQKMEVLQFEEKELEEEEQDIEKEMKTVLAQMEREEAAKKEREEEVQSLKKKVEEVERRDRRTGRKDHGEEGLPGFHRGETERDGRSDAQSLRESQRTLNDQIIKKVKGIRECREESASLRERIDQRERELEGSLSNIRLKEEALSAQKEKVEALSNEWKEAEASSKYLRQELEDVRQKIHEEEIRASEISIEDSTSSGIDERTIWDNPFHFYRSRSPEEFPKEEMSKTVGRVKKALEGFGEVNLMALEEYQELKQRHDFLTEQQTDLQQALDSLRKAIIRINRTTTKRFLETFHLVNEKFKEVFARLFKGGQASLILLDEQDPATTGIDIIAQPPGKKLQNIDLLSGGEKALVATALLFGLFMIKPTPFCLLDEVDAPLDDANINRFIELVKEFSKTSQFLLITHNKKTMETANTLYGITMETPGVSKVVSVRLN